MREFGYYLTPIYIYIYTYILLYIYIYIYIYIYTQSMGITAAQVQNKIQVNGMKIRHKNEGSQSNHK